MAPSKHKLGNPFAFTTAPVTTFSVLIYLALFVPLLVVHLVVPSAPSSDIPVNGVNTSEAWRDLQELSNGHHPYNSQRNDDIRDWLLARIEEILEGNRITYTSQLLQPSGVSSSCVGAAAKALKDNILQNRTLLDIFDTSPCSYNIADSPVTIFNDLRSNTTFSSAGGVDTSGFRQPGRSVYFEGTNIVVYVHGTEDDVEHLSTILAGSATSAINGHGGVLVNAHYDSVSTGFGATDDGVGVVTLLQLVKYFTTPGQAPKKGLVALFNNGEEDYLNGARVFTQLPISRFAHTFLNLEGAGAGGRATLFRSTDTEVTRFYKKSPHPFGTALSGDGFKRGFIRSQTDYVIFNGFLGLRGLDVAFMEPRARYHTVEDDARHTSLDSLWHMLSAALATTRGLTSDLSPQFNGPKDDTPAGTVSAGKGSDGVWFDVFGRGFAVFQLRTLFALSLTLLIVTPLFLAAIIALLYRVEKFYFFSSKYPDPHPESRESIQLHGWSGFTRFPLALLLSSALVVTLALLITKVNPLIVYSSPFSVWSMMLSVWFSATWFVISGGSFIRPSSLYRGYALMWLYVLCWALLVTVTVYENKLDLAGGYFVFFYFAAIFCALLISLLECFALPRKESYATTKSEEQRLNIHTPSRRSSASVHGSTLIRPSRAENGAAGDDDGDEDEATESTSLLRGERQTTFAHYSSPRVDLEAIEEDDDASYTTKDDTHHKHEQAWSRSLPTWTWLPQLLLLGPVPIILVGQIGLLLTSAMGQTGADGNSPLVVYQFIAIFSILLLLPLTPFIHRISNKLALFFFFVFIGTLVYNLVAFPFSANNRYKVYFVQSVDLESGQSHVSLHGIEKYVRQIISSVPSAAGQRIACASDSQGKAGLQKCQYRGPSPRVVTNVPKEAPPERGYRDWLSLNVSRTHGSRSARFQLAGKNTRACKLLFHTPISSLHIDGSASSDLFDAVPREGGGSSEVRLWKREWGSPWTVDVAWEDSEGLDGRVVCLWSDANQKGAIPALDELQRFAPTWVVVSKLADGLVEGSKAFMV